MINSANVIVEYQSPPDLLDPAPFTRRVLNRAQCSLAGHVHVIAATEHLGPDGFSDSARDLDPAIMERLCSDLLPTNHVRYMRLSLVCVRCRKGQVLVMPVLIGGVVPDTDIPTIEQQTTTKPPNPLTAE